MYFGSGPRLQPVNFFLNFEFSRKAQSAKRKAYAYAYAMHIHYQLFFIKLDRVCTGRAKRWETEIVFQKVHDTRLPKKDRKGRTRQTSPNPIIYIYSCDFNLICNPSSKSAIVRALVFCMLVVRFVSKLLVIHRAKHPKKRVHIRQISFQIITQFGSACFSFKRFLSQTSSNEVVLLKCATDYFPLFENHVERKTKVSWLPCQSSN